MDRNDYIRNIIHMVQEIRDIDALRRIYKLAKYFWKR